MKNGLPFFFISHGIRGMIPLIILCLCQNELLAQRLKHIGYNKLFRVVEDEIPGYHKDRKPNDVVQEATKEPPLGNAEMATGLSEIRETEDGGTRSLEYESEVFREKREVLDNVGSLLLIEDKENPLLHLRLQKIHASYIEVRVYSEKGRLLLTEKARNLYLGTELVFDHSFWPEGLNTLHVRMDNGQKWVKKIRKTAPMVSK